MFRLALEISPQSLILYTPKGEHLTVDIPSDLVKHQEILDVDKLDKFLASFITKYKLNKQKILILLSDKLVFYKGFSQEDLKTDPQIEDKFLEKIPFDAKKIVKFNLLVEDKIFVFATNRELSQTIKDKIEKMGGEIEFVIPITPILPEHHQPLEKEEINKILNSENILPTIDFTKAELVKEFIIPEPENLDQDTDESHNRPASSHRLLIIGIVLIWVSLGIVVFKAQTIQDFVKSKFSASQAVLPAPTTLPQISPASPEAALITSSSSAQATSSATQAEVPSGQLKFEILNGTGIAKQSAKVQAMLQPDGFTNFELGNLARVAKDLTLVNFSPRVSLSDQQKIMDSLNQMFQNVSKDPTVSLENFDVVIITGTPK